MDSQDTAGPYWVVVDVRRPALVSLLGTLFATREAAALSNPAPSNPAYRVAQVVL